RETREERDKNRYHCERRFGSFCRRMELPAGVDPDTLEAELSNGLLTVHAKKLANAQTRHVAVKGGAGEAPVKSR
ncbi:MAG: Hsp20/alpha crystallin family protein, partial [Planctomycetota bacterium]